jgi:hypothetical protein
MWTLQLGVDDSHAVLDYLIQFHTNAKPSDLALSLPQEKQEELKRVSSTFGALHLGFEKIDASMSLKALCTSRFH